MDKIALVSDRTLAGLQEKVNRKAAEGYAPEGSFNRTPDGRWFMQTMVLKVVVVHEAIEIPPIKPAKKTAAKAPKKAKA